MAERVAGTYDTTQTGYDPARAGDVAVAIAGRRISWGAVFASVIIVLIVQFVLSLLGVGIGASTINPLERGGTPEASSFGIGAGIWWLVCSLISVFAGAWVAGRLAGMPDRTDGMLHGLVAWGLAMLLLIYLLTTAVSNLVGGAFGVVGSAMQTAGQGAQEAAGAAQTPGVLAPFQQDLQQLLGQARQQAQQAGQQIQQVASDETVRQVVQKAVTAGPENLSEADRQAAINALAQHTGMTRPEAEQRLTQWQQSYQQAKQQALQTAQVTADAVSRASLWSFVALVLGAIVAAIGGMLGATRKVAYARA
jgi:F0F1-type ATP synthase membrane subunit b/b'